MKKALVYVHGKGGSAEEAAYYGPFFPEYEVIGFDYQASLPWEAEVEFASFFEPILQADEEVILIAGSLGAYFSMLALAGSGVRRAYFISPIVDMEKLITDMISWAGTTEAELREKKTIETSFGDPLSWEYLTWVRAHPIQWKIPTSILYGEKDHLQSAQTISSFAARSGADLTVMPGGEHWFHTDEQVRFLDDWIRAQGQIRQAE